MSELTRCSGIRSHALEWSCTDVHLEMVRYSNCYVYSQAKIIICDFAFRWKKKNLNFKHKHDIIKHCTVSINFQSQFLISFFFFNLTLKFFGRYHHFFLPGTGLEELQTIKIDKNLYGGKVVRGKNCLFAKKTTRELPFVVLKYWFLIGSPLGILVVAVKW